MKSKEVPYAGNKQARIVFVGESPGQQEEISGTPFAPLGASGKLIRSIVKEAGINWNALLIMNSARCRIYKDKMAGKEVTQTLQYCREYVESALQSMKPKLVVALGDFAFRQILRRGGITRHRGRFVWSTEFDCWVLPIFHPAYVLRNMALKWMLVEDVQLVAAFIKAGYVPPYTDREKDYAEAMNLGELFSVREEDLDYVGFDTETQGKDWTSPDFVPLSYSVSWKNGVARNVVLFEETTGCGERRITVSRKKGETKKKEPLIVTIRKAANFETKIDHLWKLLESEKIKKVMQHGGFDYHALRVLANHVGRDFPKISAYVMDVQAGANLLEENVFKMADLVSLQRSFTTIRDSYKDDFDAKHDKSDMLGVLSEFRDEMTYYACSDADVTRQVALSIKDQLKKPENSRIAWYFAKFVMPTLRIGMVSLEANGAMIDMQKLPETKASIEKMMQEEEMQALALIPAAIKERHEKKGLRLTRDELVADVLFDEDGFGLEPLKKTKSNEAWSVDKEVRRSLLDKRIGKKPRQFIEHLTEFGELHTIWSRYLKGFEKAVRQDGRIHSSLSITTTVTGRLSSSQPNMQNNPKRSKSASKIRELIVAPPGWLLLSADESQSELRWAAHLSGDPEMIRVFNAANEDIHTNTAKELVSKTTRWSQMTQEEIERARRNAKAVNFGLLYLMSAAGFVRYAKLEYGLVLTEKEAEEWIGIFFRKYGKLRTYHRKVIDFTRTHGYVDSPLGRRRRLPEINSEIAALRAEAERQAVNHPIQGPSSDVVLMALNSIEALNLNPEEFRVSLFVHDELIYEVKDTSKVEDYARIVKNAMENPPLQRDFGIQLSVPLVSSVKIGKNSASMEKLKI